MSRILIVFTLLCAGLSILAGGSYGASPNDKHQGATDSSAQPVNPVVQWNRTLLLIVRTPGAQPATVHPTRSFAIMHAAIYDAVNAIHHQFEPICYKGSAPQGASDEAAAVAAAHRVLVKYFPAQQSALDARFNDALVKMRASSDAKTAGTAVGEAAADALIASRANDGLEANLSYTPATGAGVCRQR